MYGADYIEAAHPTPALVPAQAFAAAKVRELITFMELHLELVARNLYPQAFFGGTVSEAAREKVGIQLEKNIAAFAKLASFAPYVAGDSFSMADCAAIVNLPLVSSATKAIYGHVGQLLEQGKPFEIRASEVETLSQEPDYAGGIWALVSLDLARLDDPPED